MEKKIPKLFWVMTKTVNTKCNVNMKKRLLIIIRITILILLIEHLVSVLVSVEKHTLWWITFYQMSLIIKIEIQSFGQLFQSTSWYWYWRKSTYNWWKKKTVLLYLMVLQKLNKKMFLLFQLRKTWKHWYVFFITTVIWTTVANHRKKAILSFYLNNLQE